MKNVIYLKLKFQYDVTLHHLTYLEVTFIFFHLSWFYRLPKRARWHWTNSMYEYPYPVQLGAFKVKLNIILRQGGTQVYF